MAFPTITGITTTKVDSANVTAHPVEMPATIAAGDLLVVAGTIDNGGTDTVTDPAGWTELYNDSISGNHMTAVCSVLKAVGDEDGTTIDWTSTEAQRSSWISFVVPAAEWTGTITDVEGAQDLATGGGTDPDPPSVTASWGSADNLWVAFAHTDGGSSTDISAYPETDNNTKAISTSGGGANVAMCSYDGAAAATRDPSAFTMTVADQRRGGTIVIKPAAAAGTTIPIFMNSYRQRRT